LRRAVTGRSHSRAFGFAAVRVYHRRAAELNRWAAKTASAPMRFVLSSSGIISGQELAMQKQFKIIVEKHTDGYVAYPLGLKGVVVGEGDTYEEALADVKSAIRFHIESFGADVTEGEPPVLEAFVAEMGVVV
jgi:predicted RNase H-like HicB family nuclease